MSTKHMMTRGHNRQNTPALRGQRAEPAQPQPRSPRTLQPGRPFGGTLFLACLILALLLGATELVTRSRPFQSRLRPPNLESRHYQLGPKLALLEAAIDGRGPVDCLFLGNSMVDLGLDPEAFAAAYEQTTGDPIHCFNFALDGIPAAATAAVAQILVQDYRPSLLVYGTDARDYAAPADAEGAAVILDSPWVRYRRGQFSLSGWLVEQVYVYRYRHHLKRLLRLSFEDLEELELNHPITDYGQTPYQEVGQNVDRPPAIDPAAAGYYYTLMADYELLPENLAGLEQITDQQARGVRVLVVEMPVPAGYVHFFGSGEADYQRFLATVDRSTTSLGVPFWSTTDLNLIPAAGWVDYSHLNQHGARVFSRWLGAEVGAWLANETSGSRAQPGSDPPATSPES